MKKSVKFSPEMRTRAVRMVAECRGDHLSQWAAVESFTAKRGCTHKPCSAGGFTIGIDGRLRVVIGGGFRSLWVADLGRNSQ